MNVVVLAIVAGLLLSLIDGIGFWLKLQSMKVSTILPTGSWTASYGGVLSVLFKCVWITILGLLSVTLGWWIVVSLAIMWFIGGWIATLIERKSYGNNFTIDLIIFAAPRHLPSIKHMDTESATLHLMSEVVPKWWIKLMSPDWQDRLRNRLAYFIHERN